MLGFDFDGGIGKLAINTEIAYFMTRDVMDQDPCLKNPYVQWILGLEYDLPLGIVAGLQYSREFESGTNDGISPIPGVLDDGYTPLSGLGMDLGFFTSNAVGCGFEKKFGESDLNAFELYAFYSIQAGEEGYMVSPALKLSHSDGVNVCVGMNIFGGAQGSRLEKYSDVSYFYTKIEYSF